MMLRDSPGMVGGRVEHDDPLAAIRDERREQRLDPLLEERGVLLVEDHRDDAL
jgi:hypothetical protein